MRRFVVLLTVLGFAWGWPPLIAQAQPTCVVQTSDTPVQAALTWTYTQGLSLATGFDVYRGPAAVGPFTRINTAALPIATLTFLDTTVAPGASYYYEVMATNAAGSSPPSAVVCKTFLQIPPTNSPTLTIAMMSSGRNAGGIVASTPAGIFCQAGQTCSAPFAPWTRVTLSETPQWNSRFVGWGGACAGTHRGCSVTLVAPTVVTATFRRR